MKIQCNVCETAEATVLCCADEAALCRRCDVKIHAANKLASKHHRVLLTNSKLPKCDICQETFGYFFCLEDRALLCRKCDVAIHTVNTFVSSHQRFLLTGVKVGAAAACLDTPSPSKNSHPAKNSTSIPLTSTAQYTKPVPVQDAQTGDLAPPSLPFTGGSSANAIQQWHFDEFLGLTDLNQNYNYIQNVSSKVDNEKVGNPECSPVLRAMEAELDEYLGQVPESSWAVPQICSPPTASGLCWPKGFDHHLQFDAAAFVPDVCYQQSNSSLERRRQ